MNFCLVEEEENHNKFILATLLSINLIYKSQYNVLISCSEKTKSYILNFPFDFTGNISWLILDNLDDNNIRYFKNILYTLKAGIEKFGEVTYIDTRLDMLNKIEILDDWKNQGIAFVQRRVGYNSDTEHERYIFNLLYVNNEKYLSFMDEKLKELIPEWEGYNVELYSIEELREINKSFVKEIIYFPKLLCNEFNLDYFMPHRYIVSTEDFFAFSNKLKLKDIDNWKIKKSLIEQEIETTRICRYSQPEKKVSDLESVQEENSDDLKSNQSKSSDSEEEKVEEKVEESVEEKVEEKVEEEVKVEEGEKEEEIEEEQVDIAFANIRFSALDNKIIAVSKDMIQRLAQKNILHFLLINLKNSKNGIEFIVPNKNGVGIWDRNNDSPGLYEMIDLICEDNPYVGQKHVYSDYFSFNNFIITDKNQIFYLNNNIRKYTALFLSRYSNLQIEALNSEGKPALFLEHISNYPKKLLEYSKLEHDKKRFIIEIKNNNTVVEWFLGKKKRERAQKTVYKVENRENLLDYIRESKYFLIDDNELESFHNEYLCDCYALQCLPVYKADPKKLGLKLLNFNDNKNYIVEPENWSLLDNDSISEILKNNLNYYENNMTPKGYLNRLLTTVFEVSLKQYQDNN